MKFEQEKIYAHKVTTNEKYNVVHENTDIASQEANPTVLNQDLGTEGVILFGTNLQPDKLVLKVLICFYFMLD